MSRQAGSKHSSEVRIVKVKNLKIIARTILEGNTDKFSPQKELTDEEVNTLIFLAINKLTERDAPALETVKMQVGFDSTYVRFEEELEAERRARDAKRKELQRIIIGVKPRGSSDFETLTTLYRQIFAYLLSFYDGPCPAAFCVSCLEDQGAAKTEPRNQQI